MSDGWVIGLLTVAAIGLGAWVYAAAVLRFIKLQPPPKPQTEVRKYAEHLAAARKQAAQAEKRARTHYSQEGTTLEDFISAFIKRIQRHWPTVSYEEARRWYFEMMEGEAAFPSSKSDWSLSAATDLADQYVADYGEDFGSNQ